MKTQLIGKSGQNCTPFNRTKLKGKRLTNELGNPICVFASTDVPASILQGNAEMVKVCLDEHNALLGCEQAADLLYASLGTANQDRAAMEVHKALAELARVRDFSIRVARG